MLSGSKGRRREPPPLASLQAFEATARLGSTIRAAGDLGRTQSAVSRQLTSLESHVGELLLERAGGKLTLTPKGSAIIPIIRQGLDDYERAITRAISADEAPDQLVIRIWPTFGTRWFLPRLVGMPVEPFGFQVDLSMSLDARADLDGLGVDGAFLYGDGRWPALDAFLVARERLVAVVSPRALERNGPDLDDHRWLYLENRPETWTAWLVGNQRSSRRQGRHYRMSVLLELVGLGQGVTVVPDFYVESDLSTGRLRAPSGREVETKYAYYFAPIVGILNALVLSLSENV